MFFPVIKSTVSSFLVLCSEDQKSLPSEIINSHIQWDKNTTDSSKRDLMTINPDYLIHLIVVSRNWDDFLSFCKGEVILEKKLVFKGFDETLFKSLLYLNEYLEEILSFERKKIVFVGKKHNIDN